MKKRLQLMLLFGFILSASISAQKNVAYQDAHVRISLVTDGLVRLEYSPGGTFVDDRSQMAVVRDYPKVDYTVKNSTNQVTVSTRQMTITYRKGAQPFSIENLTIASGRNAKVTFRWQPGLQDTQNLKGTYRTLDGYDGNMNGDKPMPMEDGLISRSGWTFIDDSNSYLFDNTEWPWLARRPNEADAQDWYFMVYGHDYKKALRDFTAVAGKIPLPPRYAFGYWWSRYWSYSDGELRDLVDRFNTYQIPLDVLVVDMDWHYTEPGLGGWTGYTWNRRLFPAPVKLFGWLKQNRLKVTLNLHPADGVKPYEEHYSEFARYLGMDPTEKKDIVWQASSKPFMTGWLQTQLYPLEKQGVDFWWLDWQQWGHDGEFPKLSNTWWINYVVFSDMQRHRDTRPMLYHRWGGIGNHRYQIGFSGDAVISWKSLDFQPYFNSTASNVLYGYWSHDIGGHMGAHSIDPEMYIRWMQFGALSPILRTHSTKDAGLNKEPWVFQSDCFDLLRDIIRQRYRLVPYIYTMARKAHDEALSLCRPLYYDYPEASQAYDEKNAYLFGDQMLVSPITSPMENGISQKQVWLPAGNDWYEMSTGTLLQGGQTVVRNFHLDEYPLYVKAGSILPLYENARRLDSNADSLLITVFPGQRGRFTYYEDNGNDKQYEQQYATTELSAERTGRTLHVTVAARQGNYRDMPSHRRMKLKVVASAMPRRVRCNGQEVAWQYDGRELALIIPLAETDCAMQKDITIEYPTDTLCVADGTLAAMRHVRQNVQALKYANAGIVLNEALGTMASLSESLTYFPDRFDTLIATFKQSYNNLPAVLQTNALTPAQTEQFLRMK